MKEITVKEIKDNIGKKDIISIIEKYDTLTELSFSSRDKYIKYTYFGDE